MPSLSYDKNFMHVMTESKSNIYVNISILPCEVHVAEIVKL